MAFSEDLSVFFGTSEFGVAATYGATTINVILDNDYLLQGGVVAGRGPVAWARAANVDADPTGDTLTIAGTAYTIRNIEPQDDGALVLLRLERQ